MIISPSISQVLRGVIHEMGSSLKDSLDPVKAAQIDTIIGVLGSCAMRVELQSDFIVEEALSIKSLAEKYSDAGHQAIQKPLAGLDKAENDIDLYEAASETLSAMADIGSAAGKDLTRELHSLFEQRLAHEATIIGGGFEAAGRG